MNYDTEMTVLYRLIENKEWDAVVERLDTNPEEASKFVEKYNENVGNALVSSLL